MRPMLAAAAAIFQRDLRLYLTYRTQAVMQFVAVLFSLALFYYLSRLLRVSTFSSPDAYFAFVVVGLVILSVSQSTLVLSQAMRGELVAGTFERILLSPFGGVRGALSMAVFPMTLSLLTGAWTLLLAALIFGLHLHWATVALAVPVGIMAALCFSAIAMFIAALVVVFKQAPGVSSILGLLALLAGFYFPVNLLPGWIQWAADVQPFTPAVDLMRHFLVGLPTTHPLWLSIGKLVGFVAILIPISTWILAKGIAAGQRRGTIIEY